MDTLDEMETRLVEITSITLALRKLHISWQTQLNDFQDNLNILYSFVIDDKKGEVKGIKGRWN